MLEIVKTKMMSNRTTHVRDTLQESECALRVICQSAHHESKLHHLLLSRFIGTLELLFHF